MLFVSLFALCIIVHRTRLGCVQSILTEGILRRVHRRHPRWFPDETLLQVTNNEYSKNAIIVRSTGRKVVSSDERMEIIQSYSNDNGRKKKSVRWNLGTLGKVKDIFSTNFCEFIPCINPWAYIRG